MNVETARLESAGKVDRRGRDRKAALLVAGFGALAMALLGAIAVWPGLDIAVARALRVGDPAARWVETARRLAYPAPYALAGAVVLYWIARHARGRAPFPRRCALVVGLALALGPGLVVNAGLKNHVPRTRPLHTSEVAGAAAPFRPFTALAGSCERNCSFPSGETAAAFATLAPALAAPAPVPAAVAALAFGAGVGALRMAAGAHFLSDVAASAALMCFMVLALRRLLLARPAHLRERGARP